MEEMPYPCDFLRSLVDRWSQLPAMYKYEYYHKFIRVIVRYSFIF